MGSSVARGNSVVVPVVVDPIADRGLLLARETRDGAARIFYELRRFRLHLLARGEDLPGAWDE